MAADSHTVLAIDDDALLLGSVVEALQGAGYTVLQASNGKEGLEMALKHHPDLVLTDNLMPILNGVDMIAGLRKDPWGKTAPVIIMTNMYTADMLNQSLEAGATDYIMKSDMSLDKIVELVRGRLKD
ncbi:MAG TPA: response regulator [Candidatus Saccharimonadales bacterium]|jgi:CheY-like chemotaxis protein|nr:response regulator [Candidatus Saccharimonadales bacterium]